MLEKESETFNLLVHLKQELHTNMETWKAMEKLWNDVSQDVQLVSL